MMKNEHLQDVDLNAVPTVSQTQPITGARFWFIMAGLSLTLFVASMDMTVVATALTKIAFELDGVNQVGLIASSYVITSTALQPLYGKFSDIFGRREMIVIALTLFFLGSVGSGASSSILMLIIFRAVAGIGGGGLVSLTTIIIADLVPLPTRSSYMGLVGANFAIASILGPLIGGALTDNLSWRWAFYINLPFCGMAIFWFTFLLKLPKQNNQTLKEKLARVDIMGSLSLIIWIILIILGISWGGNLFPWNSFPVVGSLTVGAIILVAFIYIESKIAKEPIIPGHILTRNVVISSSVSFLVGGVLFPSIIYTPVFFQIVKNESAVQSGLELLPLLLGIVIASTLSGFLISKSAMYRPLLYIGCFFCLMGSVLMSYIVKNDVEPWQTSVGLCLLGIGVGVCIQTSIIAAQAAVKPKDTAVVTSLVAFSRSLGGVVGLATLGAIFQNIVSSQLNRYLPVDNDGIPIGTLQQLTTSNDPMIIQVVNLGYARGYRFIFFGATLYMGAASLIALFLIDIPLRQQR